MEDPKPLGYSREGDIVTLRITRDDWDMLLITVGYAAHGLGLRATLGLVNRLNAGNPDFTPYEVPAK